MDVVRKELRAPFDGKIWVFPEKSLEYPSIVKVSNLNHSIRLPLHLHQTTKEG
jgi:hypothetical protein